MRGRATGAIIAALALALIAGAAGAGASPPQDDTPTFCWKEIRPCGEVIELGRHRWFNGPLVVTGYSSGIGPCIDFSHRGGGAGSCGPLDVPDAIRATSLAGSAKSRNHPGYIEVSGVLAPDVAGVRVRYRTKGRTHSFPAFTIQVTADQLRKLKVTRPFGIFEVTLRGCVPGSHIRLTAFAADGTKLGTERSFGKRCLMKDARPGSQGVAVEVPPHRRAYRLPPR